MSRPPDRPLYVTPKRQGLLLTCQIGGDENTAFVSSGGTIDMQDRAAATISSGGVGTLSESISDVTISGGGTATLCQSLLP